MNLTELLHAAQRDGATVTADVGDDWLQGRSLFGGLQAALAWAAMRSQVPADLPLRTFQMTFFEPVPAGRVAAHARVLRAGKNTVHAQAELGAPGQPLAQALAIFGSGRSSVVARTMSPAPADAMRKPLPYVPNLAPRFMRQFDTVLTAGAPPFAGVPVERIGFELALRDPGPTTEGHLLVIADFIPPVALSWLAKPAPGSSMTWMLEVLDTFADQPLRGWRTDSEMTAARDGYTSQTTTVYAPDGRALALSRQSMVVFA